ncbi:MAG: hypothetical protein COT61_02540, partial [Candidatus Portnoybacteria bacterium CG09_land_8_20_14_0_10_44_13]
LKRGLIMTEIRPLINATPFVLIIVTVGAMVTQMTVGAAADGLIQHAIRLAARPPKLAIQQQLRSDVFNR